MIIRETVSLKNKYPLQELRLLSKNTFKYFSLINLSTESNSNGKNDLAIFLQLYSPCISFWVNSYYIIFSVHSASKMASKSIVLLLCCLLALASARWVYVLDEPHQEIGNKREFLAFKREPAPCKDRDSYCSSHSDCCDGFCDVMNRCDWSTTKQSSRTLCQYINDDINVNFQELSVLMILHSDWGIIAFYYCNTTCTVSDPWYIWNGFPNYHLLYH